MNPLFVLDDSLLGAMTPADVKRTFDDLVNLDAARLPSSPCDIMFNQAAMLTWMGQRPSDDPRFHNRLTFFGVEDALPEPFVVTIGGVNKFSLKANRWKGGGSGPLNMYLLARGILIAALAARNTEKMTTTRPPGKLNRGVPKHTHVTTLRVPKVQYLPSDGPSTGREVRPHFRRGHIRDQPFGQGRRERKRVWIEPLFVKGDPEFIGAQKTYKVVA